MHRVLIEPIGLWWRKRAVGRGETANRVVTDDPLPKLVREDRNQLCPRTPMPMKHQTSKDPYTCDNCTAILR